jgi:hypothetical protein
MPNCNAFGPGGNMDIINSYTWSGGAQSGYWYLALTGIEGDLFSLELDMPLISGNSYTITFYDKKDYAYNVFPIKIGLSNSNDELWYYPKYQSFYNRTVSCSESDEMNKIKFTVKKACNYKNLQPMWWYDNLEKGNKII